jgi:hypothetical protein
MQAKLERTAKDSTKDKGAPKFELKNVVPNLFEIVLLLG